MKNIKLVPVNEDNFDAVIKLDVSKEQTKYVANNTYSLAQAYIFKDEARPMAIMADAIAVGFIMVKQTKTKHGNLLYIWRLMVDTKHQGKGYGKQALKLIIKHAEDDKKDGVILSFVPGNAKAQGLYKSLGIIETGEKDADELIAVLKF